VFIMKFFQLKEYVPVYKVQNYKVQDGTIEYWLECIDGIKGNMRVCGQTFQDDLIFQEFVYKGASLEDYQKNNWVECNDVEYNANTLDLEKSVSDFKERMQKYKSRCCMYQL
jgi:hypothetical protein